MSPAPDNSRSRLLLATIDLVRANGYASTRVEDICAAAGVTKGSFFHHFESKEDLAIAAARFWGERAVDLFAGAPFMSDPDPLGRLLGYLQFRRELIRGDIWEWSCFAGTSAQEIHETHPALRAACGAALDMHLAQLTQMIEQALAENPVRGVEATGLAMHIQAVLQGAFVMAKARNQHGPALDAIDHLSFYVEMLFSRSTTRKRPR